MITCTLCNSKSLSSIRADGKAHAYYHCANCDLRFLNPEFHLSNADEKKRYLTHNNDVEDLGYQKFVTPLLEEIKKLKPAPSSGLDFGAGTGPVLSKLLKESGYDVALYDPYFWPDKSVLNRSYDFVCACEVIEHFYEPKKEFELLKMLLKDRGALGIMTHIFSPAQDFDTWYYRRDPTHVSFYSRRTFEWIGKAYEFKSVNFVGERVALLTS